MPQIHGATVIDIIGRPVQGTRHEVLLGRERGSGTKVVVKVELVDGALATERQALEWISAHGGPVPRVRRASRLRQPDGRHAACLVLDHVPGNAPESEEAWRRLGRALARLDELPWHGAGLVVNDAHAFGATHAQRVRDLADSGHVTMTDVKDWDRLRSRQLPGNPALALTHGDPGPGNYLDDGHAGTLIDWEEAHVAPRGLDMARAMFIALLGAGPEGFIARDHAARSRAVAAGYLHQLAGAWQPHPDELRWWLTVAGIQFAHRRWQRAGQPGVQPSANAIAVLAAALHNDTWQPG